MATKKLFHVFPSFVPAGAQLRVVNLISALGLRYRHIVMALDGKHSAARNIPPDVDLHIQPCPGSSGLLGNLASISRILAHHEPDLVLTYNWGSIEAVVAARLQGRTVVHHEDGFNADEAKRLKARRNVTRTLALRGSCRVIVPSHLLFGIATKVWRLRKDQLFLVPNGISVSAFSQSEGDRSIRQTLAIPSAAPVVGFVGHLRPVKRVTRLIHMISRVSSSHQPHLLVVGDGPEKQKLQATAAALDLDQRIHFVGHRTDIPVCLQAMNLFALGSESEQMPISILEAMAAGLPIVATDVGDLKKMLPSKQWPFLVPEDSEDVPGLLANALETLLANPDLQSEIRLQNRSHVEQHYDQKTMLAKYSDIYEMALADRD